MAYFIGFGITALLSLGMVAYVLNSGDLPVYCSIPFLTSAGVCAYGSRVALDRG